MNSCGVQQNSFEEMRRYFPVSDRRNAVICPKPRRVGVLNHLSSRPLRCQLSNQMESCESNCESEILDLILAKRGGGGEEDPAARTPPLFFTGSPPSRVSNPLTKDALFRERLLAVATPPLTPRANKPQPPNSPRNGGGGGGGGGGGSGGCSPAVRVVGFDCERDSNNRSISTLA